MAELPVLPGVMRQAVFDAGKTAKVNIEERPLTIDDLLDAKEVFLTNVMTKMKLIYDNILEEMKFLFIRNKLCKIK